MRDMEFIKMLWKHDLADEPKIIFYQVDLTEGRYVTKAVEVFADGSKKNIDDFYKDVIEITELPTVEELNQGIFGDEFSACYVKRKDFEAVWNTSVYQGTWTIV